MQVDLEGMLGLEGQLACTAEVLRLLLQIRRTATTTGPLIMVPGLTHRISRVFTRGPVVHVKPVLPAATASARSAYRAAAAGSRF